jgi:hypothetical protein
MSSSSSFSVLAGVLIFFVGDFFERGQADLQSLLHAPPLVLPGADPGGVDAVVGRGTLKRHDRIVAIRLGEAVVGKFLAAWLFIGIALPSTFPFWPIWLTVLFLGEPDNGVILATISAAGCWRARSLPGWRTARSRWAAARCPGSTGVSSTQMTSVVLTAPDSAIIARGRFSRSVDRDRWSRARRQAQARRGAGRICGRARSARPR